MHRRDAASYKQWTFWLIGQLQQGDASVCDRVVKKSVCTQTQRLDAVIGFSTETQTRLKYVPRICMVGRYTVAPRDRSLLPRTHLAVI
jgi:hypothetical protein